MPSPSSFTFSQPPLTAAEHRRPGDAKEVDFKEDEALARFLGQRVGTPVTPEQATDCLLGWARLFQTLARIDQRTGGSVGIVSSVGSDEPPPALEGTQPLSDSAPPATVVPILPVLAKPAPASTPSRHNANAP
jgi:hypothetical protein